MIDPSAYQQSSARTAGYMPVFDGKNKAATVQNAGSGQTANSAATGSEGGFLSFIKGLIDVINPLQHIPVISTLYRHITGDEISPMARIAGDGLYGGPIGAAVGVAEVAFEKTTGKDVGETALAFVTGGKGRDGGTMIASAAPRIPQPKISDIVWNDAPVTLASAEEDPQAVPREQVAARMMEALDKYRAMKKAEYAPAAPAVSMTF